MDMIGLFTASAALKNKSVFQEYLKMLLASIGPICFYKGFSVLNVAL